VECYQDFIRFVLFSFLFLLIVVSCWLVGNLKASISTELHLLNNST